MFAKMGDLCEEKDLNLTFFNRSVTCLSCRNVLLLFKALFKDNFMKYKDIHKAIFKSRPNRFIAICNVDGKDEICHVKNTGRCNELLIPNCTVFLEKSINPVRKTLYDLVAVMKGTVLFNIDSSAPNKVFQEWLKSGSLFNDIKLLKPETVYDKSRFDFYLEHGDKKTFIEVKGVTLEENGVLLFPDAPTERGVKHINELCKAVQEGYEAYIVFIIQTDNAKHFTPNRKTDPQFANTLESAISKGVRVLCLSCKTTAEEITIADYVPVRL